MASCSASSGGAYTQMSASDSSPPFSDHYRTYTTGEYGAGGAYQHRDPIGYECMEMGCAEVMRGLGPPLATSEPDIFGPYRTAEACIASCPNDPRNPHRRVEAQSRVPVKRECHARVRDAAAPRGFLVFGRNDRI